MGGEGAVEILEFGFDDFRDCRDEVIVGRVVGDIAGSVEDGTKNLEIGNSGPHNAIRPRLLEDG